MVTMKQQEIKSICADKMFTASDRSKKTIYINDVVKVLEGPLEVFVVSEFDFLLIYLEQDTWDDGIQPSMFISLTYKN